MRAENFTICFMLPFWAPEEQWGRWKHGAGNNNFNLGIAYIAGMLRGHGFPVEIVDPQFLDGGIEELKKLLVRRAYDVIALPCFTPTAYEVFQLISLIKATVPQSLVVLGGGHATIYPDGIMRECPQADFSVFHEGEYTMLELCQALLARKAGRVADFAAIAGLAWRDDGVVKTNPPRDFIMDLDALPRPAYELFPLDRYKIQPTAYKRLPTYTMLVSRGCPHRCTFCCGWKMLGKKMRYRSPTTVINDMRYLIDRHGARGFMFQDTTMPANRAWMEEFCELILEQGLDITWMCYARADHVDEALLALMRKAGCWGISFGVESGNQKSLDLIRKRLTVGQNVDSINLALRLGYHVTATYILGLPGEDEKDVRRTIALAKSLGTHIAHFFLPLPYPETEMYQQCLQDGGLRQDHEWRDFSMTNWERLVYINPRLGKEKMLALQSMAIRSYYLTPKVIWRNLRSIDSLDDVKKYYQALRSLSGYLFNLR